MELTAGSSSLSLLRHVQQGDAQAWTRFAAVYVPLVFHWSRRWGLQDTDARDVCQNVFLSVSQKVHSFQADDPAASLRGWLRTITRNAIIDFHRQLGRQAPALDDDHPAWSALASDSQDSVSSPDDERTIVVQRASEVIRREVEPATWQMFCQLVLEGRPASPIAAEHGVTVWGVYKARTRVLAKFRELLGDYFEPGELA